MIKQWTVFNMMAILAMVLLFGCKEVIVTQKTKQTVETVEKELGIGDSLIIHNDREEEAGPKLKSLDGLADTLFVRLADYSDDFVYDLRYATENNFLKAKVYDCAECYMRVKTVRALLLANKEFMDKGFKIQFFDCYRPNDVQYKMWAIVPNPQYVANPVKGSIHNKGGAVDITLVDMNGKELDMGTDFDFFGKRAYHDNMQLPKPILDNRLLLKETMEKYGFWSIRTEWWHYNLGTASNDKVANFKWDCD
ncbi:MAG: M15 family metallopeptidase [Flavobacteriaceae bacterium]